MKESRLFIFFQQLDVKYHKMLHKAVNSPFFNTREDVAQLWDLLCESKSEAFEKEKVFAVLYPKQPYEVGKLNSVMNKLLDLIERVLLFMEMEENEVAHKLRLTNLNRRLGLEGHFLSASKETITAQEKSGKKDTLYYQQSYALELELYAFNAANRTSELNLQRLHDTLDCAFMVEKLRQACFSLSHQAVYRKEYDAGLLEAVLQRIESKPALLEEHPALRIYFYCYWSLKNSTQIVHFEQFRKDLLLHFAIFSESDIRDLYLLAINFCIKKNNSGHVDFARQGLELYKTALKQGFLLENGILSRFTYHNIVAWALLQQEYDWVESFINQYKNRLERTYRDSMFSFCSAKLAYSRKQYQVVLSLLQRAEYRDTLLALAAKTILMKIYYELDEFEVLEAHLSSMRAYLKRKRVLGYHKTNYQNIINYTKKLLDNSSRIPNAAAAETLRKSIEQEEILTEREWLLEQL
jgi:hypothetical protein